MNTTVRKLQQAVSLRDQQGLVTAFEQFSHLSEQLLRDMGRSI